jgi:adenosylmethionine-8-amino-7-oxononanoate aminotransferase
MGSLEEPTVNGNGHQFSKEHVNGKLAESAVLHRSLHHKPLHVTSAKGNLLCLSNGQKIFDATGGAAVSCLGSGNKRYGRISPLMDASLIFA